MTERLRPFYLFAASDVPGVVAANNFVVLYNPVSSTRLLAVGEVSVQSYASAATTTLNSMLVYRMSSPTGGTPGTPRPFDTAFPTSAAEIYTGNPTVTLGGLMGSSAPVITTGTGGLSPAGSAFKAVGPATMLRLRPGQGLVLRTEAGDTDQRWGFFVAWSELS